MWKILWTCIWRVSESSFNYLSYLPQLDFEGCLKALPSFHGLVQTLRKRSYGSFHSFDFGSMKPMHSTDHFTVSSTTPIKVHLICFDWLCLCILQPKCIVGPSSCPPGRWSKRRLRWNSFAMPGVPGKWDRWLQCFVSVNVVAKTKDS